MAHKPVNTAQERHASRELMEENKGMPMQAVRRAVALSVGPLYGGYGREALERAGAYRVYRDPVICCYISLNNSRQMSHQVDLFPARDVPGMKRRHASLPNGSLGRSESVRAEVCIPLQP